MNIKVYRNPGLPPDDYENVTRYKVGSSSYDKTLLIYRRRELIAVYNTNSWTKVVKVEEAQDAVRSLSSAV